MTKVVKVTNMCSNILFSRCHAKHKYWRRTHA